MRKGSIEEFGKSYAWLILVKCKLLNGVQLKEFNLSERKRLQRRIEEGMCFIENDEVRVIEWQSAKIIQFKQENRRQLCLITTGKVRVIEWCSA